MTAVCFVGLVCLVAFLKSGRTDGDQPNVAQAQAEQKTGGRTATEVKPTSKPTKGPVQAVLIGCMDYRKQGTVHQYVLEELDGQADRLNFAGASKPILINAHHAQEFILWQIGEAIRLHKVKKVIITHHTDCGAYGLKKGTPKDEERKLHQDDMKKAGEIIQQHFPEVEVCMCLVDLDTKKVNKFPSLPPLAAAPNQ